MGDTLRPRWSRAPTDCWWARLWFPGGAESGMEFLPCIQGTLHGVSVPESVLAPTQLFQVLCTGLMNLHPGVSLQQATSLLGTCSKYPAGEGQSVKLLLLYFSCTNARTGPKQIKVKTEGVLGKMCLFCSITCAMEMMFPTLPWPTER